MHVSLITLGVFDLDRAIAFYERMGLRRAGVDATGVAFFDLGGTALALYPWGELADDVGLEAAGAGFRAITLAWNQPDEAHVDAALARAADAGAAILKPAARAAWGGYIAYFADPDGHLWEVAFNPSWPIRDNGSVVLPPPAKGS